MKLTVLPILAALLFSISSFGQSDYTLFLKSGPKQGEANINFLNRDSLNASLFENNSDAQIILQFNAIPDEKIKAYLQGRGVTLLDYLPNLAYLAYVKGPIDLQILRSAGVRGIMNINPALKLDNYLLKGTIPSWAVKAAGTVDLWISFPKTIAANSVVDSLRKRGIEILSSPLIQYRILAIRISNNRISELASLPFIEAVQVVPQGDKTLNWNSRALSRASTLNSTADGGRGLNGQGVVVGVGDNADIQNHIDFEGRHINRSPFTPSSHGQHVSATVAGSGILNELHRGYAPKATIISQGFSGILYNAPTYVKDYGMVITNNSYGDIISCDYHGTYDLISRTMDQMALDYPNLSNVFASGNSGNSTCAPFATGFRTVLGGYQSAKNVMTVGSTNDSLLISPFSSKGPVRDGRIKPEITAMGQRLMSAGTTNIYYSNQGTSMAAPGVSGGLVLMYERYRQLNAGLNPKNGLMKAMLCNSATDEGIDGPDYRYGFGSMNLLRGVEAMEKGYYFQSVAGTSSVNNHTITVPANTSKLKVLLYWNDPAASLISSKTLVNDLDLQVINPSSQVTLPRILDSTVSNVGNAATTGVDNWNNMEQVIIQNPAAGTFTLRVNGTAITQNGSQEYFLVYDLVTAGARITSPSGGEALVPGELSKIMWDVEGMSGTVDLSYSLDSGSTWQNLATGININRRVYSWWVPQASTTRAMVRITQGAVTIDSKIFTILGQPLLSLSPEQCEGYINLNWTPVTGATDYEVMMLRGGEMKTVAFTNSTQYLFSSLSRDTAYWVTVRARLNGKEGRRAVALGHAPSVGTCAGTWSDGDLKLDAILAPLSGRKGTSTEKTAASIVSIQIRNNDNVAITSYKISYSINGAPWISESLTSTIGPNGIEALNFGTPADLSAIGIYSIKAAVENNAPDPNRKNDTASIIIRHLPNAVVNLSSAYTDGFETNSDTSVRVYGFGLLTDSRYDFSSNQPIGRLRTYINSNIPYAGVRSLTLDADRVGGPNTSQLAATFNLSSYNVLNNDLRIDFRMLSHSNPVNSANKLWARGTDADTWVEIADLNIPVLESGNYIKTPSIEISDALAAAGQSFSSSTQIRWGQFGAGPTTDKNQSAGYTIDDLRLYEVSNDLKVLSLNHPSTVTCNTGAGDTIKVSIRNTANTAASNVVVKYRINTGSFIEETIPSISANTTVQHNFSIPAVFAGEGVYNLQVVVFGGADSFRENDTLNSSIRKLPLITSFPYLQNFETTDGGWFSGGQRSTWEYGTPASGKIRSAASGSRAWKTRLIGGYNDMETSYLYSPCFSISGMSNPTLSFSLALDIEDCGNVLCDAGWVEYSTDGSTWTKLGAAGQGLGWYNKSGSQLWSLQDKTWWHAATIGLPSVSTIRFRFVLQTDAGLSREGIAIDDVHVYDNTAGIYAGTTTPAILNNVTTSGWNHFLQGGKLVASLKPSTPSFGNTVVRAFIYQGAGSRWSNGQYYGNRNIVINGGNSDSALVRFYFLQSEIDSLRKASGCGSCISVVSAYDLGISKYSDPDSSFENGSVLDNNQGVWSFITKTNRQIVPFDLGYYAEFTVKDFSEFWLNGGGANASSPLPVKLMEFEAVKGAGTDVNLLWKVGAENGVSHFEIELARGEAANTAGQFLKIGEVVSLGNTSAARNYTFLDAEASKFGKRFYRLKIVNLDGSFDYSPVRMVDFEDAVLWQVFPNPSSGKYSLAFQIGATEALEGGIYDSKGRLVQRVRKQGSGFTEKLSIDISAFAAGVYYLKLKWNSGENSFRLTKL